MASSALFLILLEFLAVVSSVLGSAAPTSRLQQSSRSSKRTSSGGGLVVKLIHRDSILSPLYNPEETIADRANRLIRISDARLASISRSLLSEKDNVKMMARNPSSAVTLELQMGMVMPLYFIKFHIHKKSSKFVQYAIMDTGSSLIWIMCSPCSNCPKNTTYRIFRPAESTTYTSLGCGNKCSENEGLCDNMGFCYYGQRYVSGIGSRGYLATETFVFEDSLQYDHLVMDNVVFGCGIRLIDHQPPVKLEERLGVFGLGQLGSFAKRVEYFSYCLDKVNMFSSQLAIGEVAAQLKGDTTPFEHNLTGYVINLERIKVGGAYEINFPTQKVIVDSGSALTYPRYSTEPADLFCYRGNAMALGGFPNLTLSFRNNAEIVVESPSLFMQTDKNKLCLAIKSTDSIGQGHDLGHYSLIGSDFQGDYNMGFDVIEKMMYIYPTRCSFL